jgi:dihydrofolate reductase
MEKKNSVFIATSLDGYIADKDGGLDWLNAIPNPDQIDMGYGDFMSQIDALVMGRNTFETVCGFDMDWPYQKPVFVLSSALNEIPESYKGKAHLEKGPLREVLARIHKQGYDRLYIDGGKVIQSFLQEDLIDELILTIIPTLLGGGTPLFSELSGKLDFEFVESKVYLDQILQNRFVRENTSAKV